MLSDMIKLMNEYGVVALIVVVVVVVLINYLSSMYKIWKERDTKRTDKSELATREQLRNHQFFSNLNHKLYNEIPTLHLGDGKSPVRQKLFRKLLEIKLTLLQEMVENIVSHDTRKMSPAELAAYINGEIHEDEKRLSEHAMREGIPSIVVKKYMMWQNQTVELLINYVNDLAIGEIYSTNAARVNTLLYVMGLQLVTIVGDAERTLTDMNGEISGLTYQGEIIE